MLRRPLGVLPAATAVIVMLLSSGCSTSDASPEPSADTGSATTATLPGGLDWSSCGGDFECAELVVPRDHTDPTGPEFVVPVIRLPATDRGGRIGSLVVNPGGPGISGVSYLRDEAASLDALRDRYDLVSFDPRGMGSSVPAMTCLSDADIASVRNQPSVPGSPAEESDATEAATSMAQACTEQHGEWLPHVGTRDVARDMDILRAELGEERLSYLGFSYGTYLGATYADMFPERTERMVLDGAMDPALDYDALRRDQAVAMDAALRRFVADCLESPDCPLSGDVDAGMAQLAGIVADLDATPYTAADGRTLSGSRALALMQSATYYPPDTWAGLRGVLADALAGDHQAMLELAHGPALMVNPADTPYLSVMCHDLGTSTDTDAVPALAAEWAEQAPMNGPSRAWSTTPCRVWSARSATPPAPVRAGGSGPILVVGTTHDPATPVVWARSLADQLEEASYLEWEGDGHLAYGRAGTCVSDVVEQFLLEGVVPPPTSTCS